MDPFSAPVDVPILESTAALHDLVFESGLG
jgi:hypothetical protein